MRMNDPLDDYDRYDAEIERKLARMPKCSECGEHIQDEKYYDFNGKYICPQCLDDNHRRWTDDAIDWE